jgi:hypothetical protein
MAAMNPRAMKIWSATLMDINVTHRAYARRSVNWTYDASINIAVETQIFFRGRNEEGLSR